MSLINGAGRRIVSLVAATLFLVSSITLPVAQAQSDTQDYEPPLIEHELVERAEPANSQLFSANVVDDKALAGVQLFYRFLGEEGFVSVEMQQVASSSVYSASVETDINDPRTIEYYIQASDEAGNRVVKGFAFSPLQRFVGSSGTSVQADASSANTSSSSSGSRKWLYIGLGVLAVGAAAALAGGGDDGGSTSGGGNAETFTLTLNPP